MTNELTREAVIEDLEWLLTNSPVPSRELPPIGKTKDSVDDTIKSIRQGQVCILSRRYINAILRHLREAT